MKTLDSFINIKNGDFLLIKGETITADTTFTILRERFPNNEVWDVGTGYYWLYFSDCSFEGKLFSVSLCFEGEQLKFLGFAMKNEKQTSWDDWSEVYELQTEKYYDQWLTAHIGKERIFSWGSIKSIYDRKGGGTAIWVNYNK
ncbi:hypothetical protein ACSQ7D_02705 [Capnocytophaga sp. G1920]|uniref:hypothetical protein n=1 Tax=Capnocytophaga sp. G1920 TaxID=3448875 RepID=UPI003EDC62A8